MLRTSRSSSVASMGLLDGLQTLQGAPPPSSSSAANTATLTLSQPTSSTSGGGAGGDDAMSQFTKGAQSMFGDFTSKLTTTLAPAVDNLNDTAKSSVTSFRRMIGDESVGLDDNNGDLEAGGGGAGGTSSSSPALQQMSLSEEMSAMFNLTMFQRLALFAMCFATGVLLVGMSFTFLPVIVIMPHKFAVAFALGNLLAIVSTWFLVGPRAQLQSMFNPVRGIAAAIYLGSLLFALFAAFFGGNLRYILVLVSLVTEIGSLGWYALSYIPYGRHMMSRLFGMITSA